MTGRGDSDEKEVRRIAASYPPEARSVPRWERDRHFSDLQRAAWDLRFAAVEPELPQNPANGGLLWR